jgi:hypothetical protein
MTIDGDTVFLVPIFMGCSSCNQEPDVVGLFEHTSDANKECQLYLAELIDCENENNHEITIFFEKVFNNEE